MSEEDVVWRFAPSEHLSQFREYALDALQQAKVYLLDHLAAAYADTLHDALTENAATDTVPALAFLGEVRLPDAVAWVEFDDGALGAARFARASPVTRFDKKPFGKGLRGFLLDDRDQGHLRVTKFHNGLEKGIVDPLCTLVIRRTGSGTLDYDNLELERSRSMIEFYLRSGASTEALNGMLTLSPSSRPPSSGRSVPGNSHWH